MEYHIPVLLHESVQALVTDPDGIYIDVTFGGGGHSKAILERLSAKGRLFGFDQDVEAFDNRVEDDRLVLVHSNFEYIAHFMRYYGIESVSGILADLGVSSHHFDADYRGFSYRFNTQLDMRMNRTAPLSAQEVLKTYSADRLQDIFSRYGELRNARTLAKAICESRRAKDITMTGDLDLILEQCLRGDRQRYFAQVYQALRIEVNGELEVLKRLLMIGRKCLSPGGRFAVITYHSLEDKLVKRYFRDNAFNGRREDEFGRPDVDLIPIGRKPVIPSAEEMKRNSRAASAKLRVAEKK